MELNNATIQSIANFTKEAKKNKMVEAVYFGCYRTGNDVNIDVVAIHNHTLCFNASCRFDEVIFWSAEENLKNLLAAYNEKARLLDNVVLNFYDRNFGDYNREIEYGFELQAIQDLVSGHIVYDRFKKYGSLRKEMLEEGIKPFSNTDLVSGRLLERSIQS